MKVWFACGYYSDLAHRHARRTEPYWDAYFFVWAVKVGSFRRSFNIHTKPEIRVTRNNFGLVRHTFGRFIAGRAASQGVDENALFLPIPSKDGVIGTQNYRSLEMVTEATSKTKLAGRIHSGLTWTQALAPAHEGGPRGKDALIPFLHVDPVLRGRDVILVDDLLSTGGSLLAAQDRLENAGVNVVGAITCGRTVYDFKTAAFGVQEYDLKEEIAEYSRLVAPGR
jgi:hypothetical protein